jgi:hypothetical protein
VLELEIYIFDEAGHEKKHVWKFTPLDTDEGHDIIRNDKARATGALNRRPFWIKETKRITIGAGMLRFPDHKANFMRLLLAHRIVEIREIAHHKVEIEFVLDQDQEFTFEYLRDLRSLKRKTLMLREKDPNYYSSFETFLKDRFGISG